MKVKVETTEVGMAMPATTVLRQSRMKRSTVSATSAAPSHMCTRTVSIDAPRHDEVAEVGGPLDAAHGANHELAPRLVEPATGQLEVLPLDRVPHLADRQALRGQPVRVDGDVDGALLAAEHEHLPDPG